MNSIKTEQAELSPLVRSITLAVIKTLQTQEIVHEEKEVINADLVPSISEKIIKPEQLVLPAKPKLKIPKMPAPPVAPAIITGKYGKIHNLLKDPSIIYIECPGVGKPLSIIRAGQRQATKISLNSKEIKELLEKIAEEAHIPLMEGVFKAAAENFIIHAVVSDVIGSRFIIKKQTPYGLLGQRKGPAAMPVKMSARLPPRPPLKR